MSESKPTLRREQIAGMNIHYIMWSLDYFLDVQQRLGFESIELWCAEPHVTLDHTGYFEAEVLAKKAADRGLRYRTLCPENVVYPWQYCARKPLHEQRSLARRQSPKAMYSDKPTAKFSGSDIERSNIVAWSAF